MPNLDEIRCAAREGKMDAPAPEHLPELEVAPAYSGRGQAQIGDIVSLEGRFRGHGVVCSVRYVQRGRNAGKSEYSVAPMMDGQFGKNVYAMNTIGEGSFRVPDKTFTKKEAQACMEGKQATAQGIADRKDERVERGRDAIDLGGLAVGDKVWVDFSNGQRAEHIIDINFATGKVAIKRPHNKSGKRWIPAALCTKFDG